jgi:hypothetical protein
MRHRLLFAILDIGQTPLSNFDCEWILHRFFSMSSRKCFKFRHVFEYGFLLNCGKNNALLVDNFVENSTTLVKLRIKHADNLPTRELACAKLLKSPAKKN